MAKKAAIPKKTVKGVVHNSHFPMQAKVTLSPSKGDFCGPDHEDTLEIALRRAQGDFSLTGQTTKLFLDKSKEADSQST